MQRVLLLCLGNICRSPMAEGAMRAAAQRHGLSLELDSAGTGGWHVGNPPDPRAIAAAATDGVDIRGLRARQLRVQDFTHFDLICAMDRQNLEDAKCIAPREGHAQLMLFRDFVVGNSGAEVDDPYYGVDAGFAEVMAQLNEAADAVCRHIAANS